MDLRAHAITQCGIDELVALDQPLAFKLRADDGGKKVLAVALDFEVLARQAGVLDRDRGWMTAYRD